MYYIEDSASSRGEEMHVTLMASTDDFEDRACILMGESIGSFVLDSDCSRTVCVEYWLYCFLETLNPTEKPSITTSNSRYFFVVLRWSLNEVTEMSGVSLHACWKVLSDQNGRGLLQYSAVIK